MIIPKNHKDDNSSTHLINITNTTNWITATTDQQNSITMHSGDSQDDSIIQRLQTYAPHRGMHQVRTQARNVHGGSDQAEEVDMKHTPLRIIENKRSFCKADRDPRGDFKYVEVWRDKDKYQ